MLIYILGQGFLFYSSTRSIITAVDWNLGLVTPDAEGSNTSALTQSKKHAELWNAYKNLFTTEVLTHPDKILTLKKICTQGISVARAIKRALRIERGRTHCL